jgi:hypothetical protein
MNNSGMFTVNMFFFVIALGAIGGIIEVVTNLIGLPQESIVVYILYIAGVIVSIPATLFLRSAVASLWNSISKIGKEE